MPAVLQRGMRLGPPDKGSPPRPAGAESRGSSAEKFGAESNASEFIHRAIPKYAVLGALLGAAMHDVNHDGHNNAFHVATASPLAMQYNDKSCLENMHTSVGLGMLRLVPNDVTEHLSAEQRRKFRQLVVDMILGTDLAHHFEQLSQLQVKAEEGFKLCGEHNDLPLLMGNLVHAADIGSTATPPPIYFDWMQRVFKEFFYQGEQEKKLGLPVTPFMDRASASIPKAQQGFLKFICQPLFKAIGTVVPAVQLPNEHMEANLAMLVKLEDFSTDQIMGAATLSDLLPKDYGPGSAFGGVLGSELQA